MPVHVQFTILFTSYAADIIIFILYLQITQKLRNIVKWKWNIMIFKHMYLWMGMCRRIVKLKRVINSVLLLTCKFFYNYKGKKTVNNFFLFQNYAWYHKYLNTVTCIIFHKLLKIKLVQETKYRLLNSEKKEPANFIFL